MADPSETKGNPGTGSEPGPKPAPRRRLASGSRIQQMLDAHMPLSDVLAALTEAAAAGEPWAVSLWLAHHWGRPTQRTDVAIAARQDATEATDEELARILAGPEGAESDHAGPGQ
jgi:hypothetical protein